MDDTTPKQDALSDVSDQQVAGLRFCLSVAALLAIYFNPAEPARFVPLTYSALVFYTLYIETQSLILRYLYDQASNSYN